MDTRISMGMTALGCLALTVASCSLIVAGTCDDADGDGRCDIEPGVGGQGVAGQGGSTVSSGGSGPGGQGGSTTSNGGTGGQGGESGQGGSTSVGGRGSGGAGGQGGSGGEGGGGTPTTCGPDAVAVPNQGTVICWYLPDADHPSNTILGLGGIVDQPTQPDVVASPFPGCLAQSPADRTLICELGDLETGTDLTLDPFVTGGQTFPMCDIPGFPTSKCEGEMWIFTDGQEIAHFIHPPMSPWSYDESGQRIRLIYTDLP